MLYLREHVEGQERQAQVVEHQEASAGERLPASHQLGPRPHDHKVHDCECEGGEVVVEKQPSPHPLVWEVNGMKKEQTGEIQHSLCLFRLHRWLAETPLTSGTQIWLEVSVESMIESFHLPPENKTY